MKKPIKDYMFILIFVLFPAFLYGQTHRLSIQNLNNELRQSDICVSDTTANVLYDSNAYFTEIDDDHIILFYNEDYMVILLRGDKWNFSDYRDLFFKLNINELPEKKGTYVLNVCNDPNNPFYCNADSLSILQNMCNTDKFYQLYEKWFMCMSEKKCYRIDKYPEKVSNQYYQYYPKSESNHRDGLEITKEGLLNTFINEYVPTPEEILQYLKNMELQPPYLLNNIINIIKEYYKF